MDLVAKAVKCDCARKIFSRTDDQQKIAAQILPTRAVRTDEAIRVDDDKYYASRTALAATVPSCLAGMVLT